MKTIARIALAGSLGMLALPASAADNVQTVPAAAPVAASALALAADPPRHAPAHGRRAKDRQRIYDDRGRYLEPRRLGRDDRIWRGSDGNYHCKRDNGTTGLVIGAGLGALAGRTIDTRGDRTVGTLLGAIAGGLLGREIDSGDIRCR